MQILSNYGTIVMIYVKGGYFEEIQNKLNLLHTHIPFCGTCRFFSLSAESSGCYVNSPTLSVRGRIKPERRRVADIKQGNRPVCL